MSNDLKFIKLIRILFIIISAVLFIVSFFDAKTGFADGWRSSGDAELVKSKLNVSVHENELRGKQEPFRVTGNDGFVFRLNKTDVVSGRVFNANNENNLISFYSVARTGISFIILVFTFFIINKLYHFLTDSSKGMIFTLTNIKRIRDIGMCCISLSLLLYFWELLNYLISKDLFSHTIYTVKYRIDFNYLLLCVGLVTMVIMQVFRKGYELKEEQAYTI